MMHIPEHEREGLKEKIGDVQELVHSMIEEKAIMLKAFTVINRISIEPGRFLNERDAILLISSLILERFDANANG